MLATILLAIAAPLADPPVLPELAEPFKVEAAGSPISATVGHAAPHVIDFNGDGRQDLIVGQFGDGKARIYLNSGSDEKPAFSEFTWLQAGGVDANVPPS